MIVGSKHLYHVLTRRDLVDHVDEEWWEMQCMFSQLMMRVLCLAWLHFKPSLGRSTFRPKPCFHGGVRILNAMPKPS